MSKKDFIALADAIRDHNAIAESIGQRPFDQHQIEVLASFCAANNSAFKFNRWLDYIAGKCGPGGGAVK